MRRDRERFIGFFGADEVILKTHEVAERMNDFRAQAKKAVLAGGEDMPATYTADAVFRKVLKKPDFTWAKDGEARLRKHKPQDFKEKPQPALAVVGARLRELAGVLSSIGSHRWPVHVFENRQDDRCLIAPESLFSSLTIPGFPASPPPRLPRWKAGRAAVITRTSNLTPYVPRVTIRPQEVVMSGNMTIDVGSPPRVIGSAPADTERVAVSSSPTQGLPSRGATFRDVFKVREFRSLWTSYLLSFGGDRLALIALTLLIYDRTHSPLLAAVAYAAGTVPYFLGGLFLSGLADRLPRRGVMVACDILRTLLVGVMLLPRMPLDALIGLLYAVTAVQPVFDAARSAIIRDVLPGPRYPIGATVMSMTTRTMVIGGAALGGLIVALVGARYALGVDGATFVASALLIQTGLKARPAAVAAESGPNELAQIVSGIKLVFGDRVLRTLLLLGWLAAFYEIPEGIAAPYAARLGGGAVATGLLIAFSQVGAVACAPFFTSRIGPLTRLRWMGPMAVCTCGILVLTVLRPGLPASMAIFALSGSFGIYQIAANTAFVERVPNERRAQAFGLANAGMMVGQGLAFALAGAAAEVVPPSAVTAIGGGLGAVFACGLALRWRRLSPAVGRHSARHLGREASLARQAPVQIEVVSSR
jgi:hypothetical protein